MYIDSTYKSKLTDMGVATVEKRTQKGKTSGFQYIQARITKEEEDKIKEVLQATKTSPKHLFRPIIRWLPKSGCYIESVSKGDLPLDCQFRTEVTPEEKKTIRAIASGNGMTVTDVIRWIINNLDWIGKEI